MRKLLPIIILLLSGCFFTASKQPAVLTSSQQQWTVPKGVEFQALQLPAYKELTKFIADEDLAVLYKGSLLELEEEANRRVFKTARAKKKEGTLLGIIGSISALLAGLAGKKIIKKKVKK